MRADEFPPDLGEPRTQALGHSVWLTDPHASGDGRQVWLSLTEHYRHVAPGVNPATHLVLDIELSEPDVPLRRFSIEIDSHGLVDLAALGVHGVQHIREEAARDWPWPVGLCPSCNHAAHLGARCDHDPKTPQSAVAFVSCPCAAGLEAPGG